MKFGSTPVAEAHDGILAHAVFAGRLKLAKGTLLGPAELQQIADAGIQHVVIARLAPADVPENLAAHQIARALAGPAARVETAARGRCNIFAAANGLVHVDPATIDGINAIGEAITIATLPAFRMVRAGEMIATVKIIPFAVAAAEMAQALDLAATGAIDIAPFGTNAVAAISTTLPRLKPSVLDKSVRNLATRLRPAGASIISDERVEHATGPLVDLLRATAAGAADLLVIFGASATADRKDVVPAAIEAAGGTVLRYGMPVDPGNLLVLGHIAGKPVIGAPGCARSPRENGFDFVLQRLLAGISVGSRDIARMGVGGLLQEIPSRPQKRIDRPARLAAVVLGAGQGSRMGGGKMTALLHGTPLLLHAVDTALASEADPVIVVLGHDAPTIRALLADRDVLCIDSPDHAMGLSHSLRAGLQAVPPEALGALVMLGDMPGIDVETVNALAREATVNDHAAAIVPTFTGKRGNPVVLLRRLFAQAMALTGDVGARALLSGGDVVELAVEDPAILLDIDTPQDLASHQAVTD